MCGIVGFLDKNAGTSESTLKKTVEQMARAIAHRGPDASGVWADPRIGLALGHRRLSILDLSESGAQPFISGDQKHVLVFNGEIYNFLSIAEQLRQRGHSFRGGSDTEVVLAAFREWGCEAAVEKMLGMFAFAYFDGDSQCLWLGRDRLGEKPLYYGWQGGKFAFASELKSFRRISGWQRNVSRDSVEDFLRFGYVPGPESIYEGISKLVPGTLLRFPVSGGKNEAKAIRYWDLEKVAQQSTAKEPRGEAENLTRLEEILTQVVGEQTVADVPVGAFLSGGIDSSLIVALMQKNRSDRVKTFTIGFAQKEFDEAGYARQVAQALGTDHTEVYVDARDALRVIPKLPFIYDEPFADSSQIPTYLVAEMARSKVTVSLSGDGGDETFAGYNRHFLLDSVWGGINSLPRALKIALASSLSAFPLQWRNRLLDLVESMAPRGRLPGMLSSKVDKLIMCLQANDLRQLYLDLVSQESRSNMYLQRRGKPSDWNEALPKFSGNPTYTMQLLDSLFYLPNDILTKVDRATMAVGLESRSPFLDPRVVEFAWTLPQEQRVRGHKGKWMLRQLLAKHIPQNLIDRPKSGFAIPINDWLKGPLRPWAEEMLHSASLKKHGYLRPKEVGDLWHSYLEGKTNSQYKLWSFLMLQAWLEAESETNSPLATPEMGQTNFSYPSQVGT